MGRSTRFFGARVLRSGRRVWTGPIAEKCSPGAVRVIASPDEIVVGFVNEDEEMVNEALGCNKQENGIGCRVWNIVKDVSGFGSKLRVDVDEAEHEQEREKLELFKIEEKKEVEEIVDKMYGIVYRRKRKRKRGKEQEGIQYFRRKKRRGVCRNEYGYSNSDFDAPNVGKGQRKSILKISIVERCYGFRRGSVSVSSYLTMSSLLHSILRYLRRTDIRLWSLHAFVCTEPIVHVFEAHGIRFMQNFNSVGEVGSCTITGVRSSVPVFSVDFASLPFFFLHLHYSLSLSFARSFYFSKTDLSRSEEELNSINKLSSFKPLKRNQAGHKFVVDIGTIVVALPAFGMNKVGGQSVHINGGCKIQKRRISNRIPNGASCHSSFRSRHDHIQFPTQVPTHQLRSSTQRKVMLDVNKLKSTSVDITQKIGANGCSANILVIESANCYRVEGALITLELSESNHWSLTIRKDGVKRYSITAQNVMRPCSNNRITHDIVWSTDTDMKLEFPNRHDWLIFKELYKECFERNLKIPAANFIPVPRVSEVDGYRKISCLPFERPGSYISVKDDELARVWKKRTATYDMDSDDEDWLHKFNSVYNKESKVDRDLSAERFELMIDELEKACHCNPDVSTNAEAAYSIFPNLEREVVEAVYNNWIMKRKLKRAALIQVFQFYPPMKPQLITTFNSRRKRSFKRQGSQAARGKQRSFFHAFLAEQDAIEQQNILKLQEAKATLDRLENLASQKRQRAQELFENSELATYKALMAVRISEAAQLTESTHVAASYILSFGIVGINWNGHFCSEASF